MDCVAAFSASSDTSSTPNLTGMLLERVYISWMALQVACTGHLAVSREVHHSTAKSAQQL